MRRVLCAAAAILTLATLGVAVPACFKPDHPACAFSCAEPPHTCPSGYTCGADNLCHDPLNSGFCLLEPFDAATPDAGVTDAGNGGDVGSDARGQ
jgi:hypothetical protein